MFPSHDRAQRMRYYEDYIFNVQLMKLEFPNNQDENVSRDDGNHMIDAGYKKVANYKFERCHMTEITAMDFNPSKLAELKSIAVISVILQKIVLVNGLYFTFLPVDGIDVEYSGRIIVGNISKDNVVLGIYLRFLHLPTLSSVNNLNDIPLSSQ